MLCSTKAALQHMQEPILGMFANDIMFHSATTTSHNATMKESPTSQEQPQQHTVAYWTQPPELSICDSNRSSSAL
jgi:hypothetical protein